MSSIQLSLLPDQQRDEQEFHLKTIGHCDPWFNNMMFRWVHGCSFKTNCACACGPFAWGKGEIFYTSCIFRYDEDLKPQSVMFIDFQLVTKVFANFICFWSSIFFCVSGLSCYRCRLLSGPFNYWRGDCFLDQQIHTKENCFRLGKSTWSTC